MSYGTDIFSDPLGVGSWWGKYGAYVWFGLGGFAGWTLSRLLGSSTTVVVRSEGGGSGKPMRGWSRACRLRRKF